jgi:DUF1680 family protein
MNRFPDAGQVTIDGGFLAHYMQIVADARCPTMAGAERRGGSQPDRTQFSHRRRRENGEFAGVPYQDTDLAKWLDAVGYALANGNARRWKRWPTP